jgi:deoxyribose-phosphate aldolase
MAPDELTVTQLAKMIDHSLIRPELTIDVVRAGCAIAVRHNVITVCVKSADVRTAVAEVSDSGVRVSTVIGFPHGNSSPDIKAAEADSAIIDGAAELDMVVNIGRLRGGDDKAVLQDISAVVTVAERADVMVKVILETAYLTDKEKIRGCRLAESAGARFVKTSTGFAPKGATVEDIRLMRSSVSSHVGVKAAGKVHSLDILLGMATAGATRFGTSATATILDELAARRGELKVAP